MIMKTTDSKDGKMGQSTTKAQTKKTSGKSAGKNPKSSAAKK